MTKNTSARTPNDQTSDLNNPTSPEFKAAQDNNANIHNATSGEHQTAIDNEANQMSPNNPVRRSSRKKKMIQGKKKWPDLTDWALKRLWRKERF
jgi:hypothetical protein